MEFLEESKRMDRHKAREELLAAIEKIAVSRGSSGHGYGRYNSEDRTVHDVKADMLAAVKSVLE